MPGADIQAKMRPLEHSHLSCFLQLGTKYSHGLFLFWDPQASLDLFPISSSLLCWKHSLFYIPLPLGLSKKKLIHNRCVDSFTSGTRGCFTGLPTSLWKIGYDMEFTCSEALCCWSPVVSKWIQKQFRGKAWETEMVREGEAGGMPNPWFH